jgi:hypothetical protein
MDALDLAAEAALLLELHHGQEEVDVQMEPYVEGIEQVELRWTVITPVAHGATYHRPVLLFDIGVVIPSSGSASGEGNLLFDAVTNESLLATFLLL